MILVLLNFLFISSAPEFYYSRNITLYIVQAIRWDYRITITELYGRSFRGQIKGVPVQTDFEE